MWFSTKPYQWSNLKNKIIFQQKGHKVLISHKPCLWEFHLRLCYRKKRKCQEKEGLDYRNQWNQPKREVTSNPRPRNKQFRWWTRTESTRGETWGENYMWLGGEGRKKKNWKYKKSKWYKKKWEGIWNLGKTKGSIKRISSIIVPGSSVNNIYIVTII